MLRHAQDMIEVLTGKRRKVKIPFASDLGPEVMHAAGLMELSRPGEHDVMGLFAAIRRHQPVAVLDHVDHVYGYLDEEDEKYRYQLDELIDVGARAVRGKDVYVNVRETGDANKEGHKIGSTWHSDHGYTMNITEGIGSIVLIDPDDPGRFVSAGWESIEDATPYLYLLRPEVLNIMHEDLYHIMPTEDMMRQCTDLKNRRLLRISYLEGMWPDAPVEIS